MNAEQIVAYCISTHTLTWSVTGVTAAKVDLNGFQLTRSRGAWHIFCKSWHGSIHFNSHAHVERDQALKQLTKLAGISTHTLTWSVTLSSATFAQSALFQLTRSRGAWPRTYKIKTYGNGISTHTLTWSVTIRLIVISSHCPFQLTRSRGAWLTALSRSVCASLFQLTRSRGAWHGCFKDVDTAEGDFNSHAHVERDG